MKIIVATDGSKESERALAALKNMQWESGTEIKLITVLRVEGLSLPFAPKTAERITPDLVQSVQNALSERANDLSKIMEGCSVTYEVAQGDAKSQIVEQAKKWGADLIFIGSRGIRGVELMFLGSVSEGVLLQSPCPVFIVKSGDETESRSEIKFKNVVVALDNSPYSRAAAEWLKTVKWPEDCRFRLITVVPSLIESVESLQDAATVQALQVEHNTLIASAKADLENEAEKINKHFGSKKASYQVGEGDPRDLVLKLANSAGADLIVMGSHGRSGLEKLLIGSVSQAVAVQSECSVAIIRGLVPKGAKKMQLTGRYMK